MEAGELGSQFYKLAFYKNNGTPLWKDPINALAADQNPMNRPTGSSDRIK